MEEVDILSMLDGKPDSKPYKNKTKSKYNYWEDADIPGKEIDVAALKPKEKSFTIVTYVKDGDVPQDIKDNIIKLGKALLSKGYTFRFTGDMNDDIQEEISITDVTKVKAFLPWAKFNTNISDPYLKKPTDDAYHIAAGYHKAYKKLPNSIRVILARNVNALLDKDCLTPTGMIIAYTEDGAESLNKKLDFKKTGPLAFYLSLANEADIPVFNMRNEDSVSRLSNYINTVLK